MAVRGCAWFWRRSRDDLEWRLRWREGMLGGTVGVAAEYKKTAGVLSWYIGLTRFFLVGFLSRLLSLMLKNRWADLTRTNRLAAL